MSKTLFSQQKGNFFLHLISCSLSRFVLTEKNKDFVFHENPLQPVTYNKLDKLHMIINPVRFFAAVFAVIMNFIVITFSPMSEHTRFNLLIYQLTFQFSKNELYKTIFTCLIKMPFDATIRYYHQKNQILR